MPIFIDLVIAKNIKNPMYMYHSDFRILILLLPIHIHVHTCLHADTGFMYGFSETKGMGFITTNKTS